MVSGAWFAWRLVTSGVLRGLSWDFSCLMILSTKWRKETERLLASFGDNIRQYAQEQGHHLERSRQAGGMHQQKHHVSQQAQMQSCNTLVQAGDWPTWEQFCQESLWVLADSPLHMKQQCSLAGRKTVGILGCIKRSVASVLIHSYLALFTWQSRMLHPALGPPIKEAGVTPVV